jgi:putative Holliday junction resolvase
MRIMGLDVGEKRIGVAVSDPLGYTAQGISVVKRENIEDLKKIVSDYNIGRIIAGLPKNMDGSIGEQGEKVLTFIEELKKEINLPILTWDERLTTKEAEGVLLKADLSRAKRKKVIDKLAAILILQSYLDSQRTMRK